MSLFKKIVVGTLIVASVSIGIGAYIIYEKGYSTNDLGQDFKKLLDGEQVQLDLGNLKSLSFEGSYILNGKDKITLDTNLGDVQVSTYDGNDLILMVEGEVAERYYKNYLQVKETSGELTFKLFDGLKRPSFFRKESNNLMITLKVPKAYSEDMEISTIAGDIQGNELTLGELTLNSISGDVDILRGNQDEVLFSMISGDLNVDGEVAYISGDSVSGDVTLKNATGFDVETVSGDLVISSYDQPENSQVESVSGNIRIEILGKKEVSYDFETISGEITVETLGRVLSLGKTAKNKGTNGNIVKGSTVSGDILLKN